LQVIGRPVKPIFVPPEERAAILAKEGIDGKLAQALLGMYAGIADGHFAREEVNEQHRGDVSLTAAVERIVSTLQAA
jgi:hypothetical protein